VTINDVGTFFQSSFVKALTSWDIGTPEQRKNIATGKDLRATFTFLDRETITYNALEIVLLEKLMEAYRNVCTEIGYMPRDWQGPGCLATAMMKHHGMPKRDELNIPDEVNDAAVAAYYGGRFETTAVGEVPGPIYAYDINSAYPDAMRRLPCVIHGTWENVSGLQDVRGRLYLAHGTYEATEPANLYNYECRVTGGRVRCPENGSGWYWSVEIENAAHQTFKADTIYALNVNCDCQPFDWVPAVYAERIRLGKSTKGMVLKLAMNSLYGKTAQSVGAAPYANAIWAGLITAMTRAKLSTLCHDDPKTRAPGERCRCYRVYMLATDAIFTSEKLDIPSNKDLGGWELTEHGSMFIIMPGLYFTDADIAPKTRGIPRQKVIEYEPQLRAAYAEMAAKLYVMDDMMPHVIHDIARDTHIVIPMIQFVGLKIANHRGRLDLAGEWMMVGYGNDEPGRHVGFNWASKREVETATLAEIDPVNRPDVLTILTTPFLGGRESLAYDKDIGRRKDDNDETKFQPDWADVYKGDEL
jgi:hypothetical protein